MRFATLMLIVAALSGRAALGGLRICMDGGCCHAAVASTAHEAERGCEAATHEHSPTVVQTDAHDCGCTDVDVEGVDVITTARSMDAWDDLLDCASAQQQMVHWCRSALLEADRVRGPPGARPSIDAIADDCARQQRLRIVRAVRINV